jgi:hypothetical protein
MATISTPAPDTVVARIRLRKPSATFLIQCAIALLLLVFVVNSVQKGSSFDFDNQYYGALVARTHHSYLDYHAIRLKAKSLGLNDWNQLREPSGPPTLINLIFVPLSMLRYNVAKVVFALLAWGSAVVALWALANRRFWALALFFFLYSFPSRIGLALGNASFIISAMVGVSLALVARRKWTAASSILGVAAALRIYPAFLLLFLPWRRNDVKKPFAVGFGTTIVLSMLFPAPNLSLREWQYTLGFAKNRFGAIGTINVTFSGLVSKFSHNVLLSQAVAVLCLCLLLWVAHRVRNWDVERRFVFGIVTLLLFLPVAWVHYYLLILIAMPWIFDHINERQQKLGLLIAIALLLWTPPFDKGLSGISQLVLVPEAWVALILCLLCLKLKPSDPQSAGL